LCGKFIVLSEIHMNGNRGFEKLRVFCILGAATASVGMLPSAKGAPIIFGSAQNITGQDTDINTTGTLIEAYEWYDGGTTVNGVAFAGSSTPSGSINGNPNAVLNFDGGGAATLASGFAYGASTNAPYSTSVTPEYNSLLAGAVFNGGDVGTLTLGGLTPGLTYELQLWANDSRGNSRNETLSSGTIGDTPVTLDYSTPPNTNGQMGQFAIGIFVADSSGNQVIDLSPGGLPGNNSAQINAFQLRQVPAGTPEPATLGLLGIATLGMLTRRRRA
jgi:PEP-CTERM motif